jgi:hypothetical protein
MANQPNYNGLTTWAILGTLVLFVALGGLSALGSMFVSIVSIAAFGYASYLVVKVLVWLFSASPVKTVTRSKTWSGGRKTSIEYHDTGKKVEYVSGTNWLGRNTKKTYVKPGDRRKNVGDRNPRSRSQQCKKCGSAVFSTDGSFSCSCGRRWGRR